jgi:DNA-binding MarR family transcriptional regulator
MHRKEIVGKVQDRFEITSSGVTRALRGMMRPPLALVRLAENAESGREKTAFLTAKGERFLNTMVTRGLQFLQRLLEQTAAELSSEEVDSGIKFFCGLQSRAMSGRGTTQTESARDALSLAGRSVG